MVVRIDETISAKLSRLADAWSCTRSVAIRRLILEAKVPKQDIGE